MKILLTGASGFIGKALFPALVCKGHEVTLLSRERSNPAGISEEIVCETAVWPQAVTGRYFDVCIHLAWIAKPGIYGNSPENGLFASMTPLLADTLFQAGLPNFFGLGTSIEYAPGQTNACDPATTTIAPQSLYGKAKDYARSGIAESSVLRNKGYTWARLFYPYGSGEHPERIPSTFLRTLHKGEPLELKTPHSVKDWIEIKDVVSAIVCVVENGEPLGEINLGTGNGTDILTLARLAAAITGQSPDLVKSSTPGSVDSYAYHVADIRNLSAIGWKPRINLQEGLQTLANHLNLANREY